MNPRIIYAVNEKFHSGRGFITHIEHVVDDGSLRIKARVPPDENIKIMAFDLMDDWFPLLKENKPARDAGFLSDNNFEPYLKMDPQQTDTLVIANPIVAQFFIGVFHQVAQEIIRPTWKLLDELIKHVSAGKNVIRVTHAPTDNFNLNECWRLHHFFNTYPQFKIAFAKEPNHASGSSMMLSGGPRGVVFTLESSDNSLIQGLFNAQKYLATSHRSVKDLIQMFLSGEYDLSEGIPFSGLSLETRLARTEMQQLIDFFSQTHPELDLFCAAPTYNFYDSCSVYFDKKGEALRIKLQQALEIIELEELFGHIKNAANIS